MTQIEKFVANCVSAHIRWRDGTRLVLEYAIGGIPCFISVLNSYYVVEGKTCYIVVDLPAGRRIRDATVVELKHEQPEFAFCCMYSGQISPFGLVDKYAIFGSKCNVCGDPAFDGILDEFGNPFMWCQSCWDDPRAMSWIGEYCSERSISWVDGALCSSTVEARVFRRDSHSAPKLE